MTEPLSGAKFSGVMPLIRGLLAEPSGNDDIPYNRVILRLSVDKKPGREALYINAGMEFQKQIPTTETSEGTQKVLRPPTLLANEVSCIDYNSSPEKLREELFAAISNFSKTHGSKPGVVILPDGGVFYVERMPDGELPLRNEVALVTGAAGAIGSGICRALLENGCHVAATDLPGRNLDDLVKELRGIAGERIIGVGLDVTDRDSVADGFNEVSRNWGGVDIVIVNAGIPLIGALTEMDLDEFRKLEKVNVEGTLLTLSEAGRHLRLQGTGGDIVIISTKNVFAPGARFGGYSATKAAAHQLARIASLELAEFGIRVNMVSPDAVFSAGERKSGLWEKIGPDRMRDKGIVDREKLQEYYRTRNLLKARVTAQHVANAVLFFVTRQTPTTGATIPVDGGLPDATPR